MRVRGLKFDVAIPSTIDSQVAPYAGAWIEIFLILLILRTQ